MQNSASYRGLRFSRGRRIPRRPLAILAVLVAFGLLRLVATPSVAFWISLPSIGILTWMATHGWRPVLAKVAQFLQTLDDTQETL